MDDGDADDTAGGYVEAFDDDKVSQGESFAAAVAVAVVVDSKCLDCEERLFRKVKFVVAAVEICNTFGSLVDGTDCAYVVVVVVAAVVVDAVDRPSPPPIAGSLTKAFSSTKTCSFRVLKSLKFGTPPRIPNYSTVVFGSTGSVVDSYVFCLLFPEMFYFGLF